MPNIEVQVADAAWQSETDDPESITRRVVGALTGQLDCDIAGVTVRFANDDEVRALNAQYRHQDKPTNVLSFPAPPAPDEPYLGDVILAYGTVRIEAEAQGKTLADHTAHLIAHGLLHLLGYDHQTNADAERMEALERDVLARLGVDDPYKDQILPEAAHGA